MKTQEIIKALRRMAANTDALNCLGCGYEHSCDVRGCRVLREAADKLTRQDAAFELLYYDRKESGLLDE